MRSPRLRGRSILPPAFAALALCASFYAAPAFAEWTARGAFLYSDRLYDAANFAGFVQRPVREADVELFDADTLALIAVGATDREGAFALVSPDGPPRRLGVRVLTSTEQTESLRFSVLDDGAMGAVHAFHDPLANVDGHDGASDADFGTMAMPLSLGDPATADTSSMAFNVFDGAVLISDWIASREGERPPTPFGVRWGPLAGRGGSFYDPSVKTLFMADRDAYNDPVILHELGHYVDDHYGELDDTGGPHFIGDDSQDARLSWGEGLATWFCNATLLFHDRPRPDLYVDRDGFAIDGMAGGFSYSLESISSGGGSTNEAKVNAALYDLIDGASAVDATPGADDDALSGLDANVWAVVRELRARATVHAQMEDFGDLWFDLGFGMEPELAAALGAHRIEFFPDANEPNDHPETATPLAVGPTFRPATFYKSGARNGGDEDWYSFAATAGTWYLAEVNPLSGNIFGRPDPEMILVDMGVVAPLASSDDPFDSSLNNPFSSSAQRMSETAPSILFLAPETQEYHLLLRHASRLRNVNGRHGSYALRVQTVAAPAPNVLAASAQSMLPGQSYPLLVRAAEAGVGATLECDNPGVSFFPVRVLAPTMIAATAQVDPSAAPGSWSLSIRNADGVAGAALANAIAISATAQPPIAIMEVDLAEPRRVEIMNRGDVSATLTGWSVRSESPDTEVSDFAFPDAFQLAAGARVVLSDQAGTNSETELFDNAGLVDWAWFPGFTGDVSLVDVDGDNVDFLRFVFSYVTAHQAPSGVGGLWGQPEIQAPEEGFTLSRAEQDALFRTTLGLAPASPSLGAANETDPWEDNDSPRRAPVLALSPQFDGLAISPRPVGEDVDWFGFMVGADGGARFDLIFEPSAGELEFAIYAPGAEEGDQPLAFGKPSVKGQVAFVHRAHAAVGRDGVYRIRVSGVEGATNSYSLRAERWPIGDAPTGFAIE